MLCGDGCLFCRTFDNVVSCDKNQKQRKSSVPIDCVHVHCIAAMAYLWRYHAGLIHTGKQIVLLYSEELLNNWLWLLVTEFSRMHTVRHTVALVRHLSG